MGKNTYKHGDWNFICQRCQKQIYASQSLKEWTGLRVCDTCWEIRHPQDFVRGVPDPQAVPFISPVQGDPTTNSQEPFDPNTDSIWQSVPQ